MAQDLNLFIAASDEVLLPRDFTTVTIIASNKGSADLQNVVVSIQLPNHIRTFDPTPIPNLVCPGGTCGSNETGTWTIGTLKPGESKIIAYQLEISATAPQTNLLNTATANSSNGTNTPSTSINFAIEPTSEFKLNVIADKERVEPGGKLIYALYASNMGSSSPSGTTLHLIIPTGSSFISASHGGTLSGDTINWNVGLFPSEESKIFDVTLQAGNSLSDGDALKSSATLKPNTPQGLNAKSSTIRPVKANNDLVATVSVNQTSIDRYDEIIYLYTVTNTGSNDLLNVSGSIYLPNSIRSFDMDAFPKISCPGVANCKDNEVATWTIGTLPAGHSQTVYFNPETDLGISAGEILRTEAIFRASNANYVVISQAIEIDKTPLLQIGLCADTTNVAVGKPLKFNLTFGNVGAITASNVKVIMPLPANTSFVSANKGGIESNGVISWQIPNLPTGEGDQFEIVVTPQSNIEPLLKAEATIDAGNTETPNRSITTVSQTTSDLLIDYKISPMAAGIGNSFTHTLTVTNVGASPLLNTNVKVLLPHQVSSFSAPIPDFTCPGGSCGENEIATWDIGTLNAAQSKTVTFNTPIPNGADPGRVIHGRAVASCSNSNVSEAVAQRDMLIGTSMGIGHDEFDVFKNISLSSYPNPFSNKTTFTFTLTSPSKVSLKIYNTNGKQVAEIFSENLGRGEHSFDWDGSALPKGVYYGRLVGEGFDDDCKMVIR
ncbi:T9SS type A sorting domain-containing protein [Owenweeksia hongkongensis]|uniref:T9SS type A sorting domain-containing protein n=1 Tax=Owenweeksia hongkongensis TaxID=253245 RepID=UPI003A90AF39